MQYYKEKGFDAIYKEFAGRREKAKQMGGPKAVEGQPKEGKLGRHPSLEEILQP